MSARAKMLEERADEEVAAWMAAYIQPERLAAWGHPDTSACPLVSFSAQAARPGLYVKRPTIRGPAGSEGLVGERGLIANSALWPMMQRMQYFAVGINSIALRVSASPDLGRLSYRRVFAHDLYAVAHPDDPRVPVRMCELRLRVKRNEGGRESYVWAWDVWSIEDAAAPYFRVVEALGNGGFGEDITAQLGVSGLRPLAGTDGEDRYPYWDGARPVLPWVIYRAIDDGTMWCENTHRSAFRGSLNAMLNWSSAQHAARDASGSTRYLVDGEVAGARIQKDPQGNPTNRVIAMPGDTVRVNSLRDSKHQARVENVGPGANLAMVAAYAQTYELNVLLRMGLNPTDITRTNNTPTSGAAIALSNSDRRALQEMYAPLFLRADLETIKVSAIVANTHGLGGGDYPTSGYSLTYEPVPMQPAEMTAQREDLDWRVEKHLMSPSDRYMKLHPGSTREDALDAIAKAMAEQEVIDAKVAVLRNAPTL